MTACAYLKQCALPESNDCDLVGAKIRILGRFKESFSPQRVHHFNNVRQERLLQILSGQAISMRHRK